MIFIRGYFKKYLDELGAGIIGRGVTNTLYVSPNGDGSDGTTWAKAYTTIQGALDAASTDGDACTLILISPHTTNYDINTTGDPTYTGNYILKGTHRNWAKIKNNHASATSILKFTGKTSLIDLNFNLGSGSNNGVIMTHGGWRIYDCQFVGEDLTGAATAVWIDGDTTIKHGKMDDVDFLGHATHMTALKLDNASRNHISHAHIHECTTGVHIVNASSDENYFKNSDIGSCGIGFDIDAGNEQHLTNISFHGNTTNIDDEVGDHIYERLYGEFPGCMCPDNLTGVTLTAHADANTYGSDTEIKSAAESTVPFRITGYIVELNVAQKYEIRLSDDSGSTFFDYLMMDAAVGIQSTVASDFPPGTEYIFNKGTRISGSVKAESGGGDTCKIWLKSQII